MKIKEFKKLLEKDTIPGFNKGVGRVIIIAYNEGGYNKTEVDLLDVIEWVKENKPELLKIKILCLDCAYKSGCVHHKKSIVDCTGYKEDKK